MFRRIFLFLSSASLLTSSAILSPRRSISMMSDALAIAKSNIKGNFYLSRFMPSSLPICLLSVSISLSLSPSSSFTFMHTNAFSLTYISHFHFTANKVMIFSKTYCPYCMKAKEAFKEKGIAFGVMELDKESNGAEVQKELEKMTGQRTVPNVFIKETHLGGCDDTLAAFASGKLLKMLE